MLMRQERGVCTESGEAHMCLTRPIIDPRNKGARSRPGRLSGAASAAQRDPAPSCSLDLLELDGTDLRREPIEARKATLAIILRKSGPGVQLNEHLEHPDEALVLAHAAGWEPR
jgi:hypothetical protein